MLFVVAWEPWSEMEIEVEKMASKREYEEGSVAKKNWLGQRRFTPRRTGPL